jgi:hypothetical protein
MAVELEKLVPVAPAVPAAVFQTRTPAVTQGKTATVKEPSVAEVMVERKYA